MRQGRAPKTAAVTNLAVSANALRSADNDIINFKDSFPQTRKNKRTLIGEALLIQILRWDKRTLL